MASNKHNWSNCLFFIALLSFAFVFLSYAQETESANPADVDGAATLAPLSTEVEPIKEDDKQPATTPPAPLLLCPKNVEELLSWGVGQNLIPETSLTQLLDRCHQLVESHPQFFALPQSASTPEGGEDQTLNEPGIFSRAASAISSKFTLLNVLYGLGALLVIGAMTLFMTVGWEMFGGAGMSGIATLYGLLFAVIGRFFYEGPQGGEWEVVCSLLLTMTVFMTPLAVYGMQRHLGLWTNRTYYTSFGDKSRIPMTLGVMTVSALILAGTKFSFFLAPVAAGAWLVTIDNCVSHHQELNGSLILGLVMSGIAIVLDKVLGLGGAEGGTDFTFWLYSIGVLSFWVGLSFRDPSSEANGVMYLCINVFLAVGGLYLDRIVLILIGVVGILVYSYLTLLNFKISSSRLILLRFILSLLLLAAAHKYHSQVAFWAALAGIIAWNTSNAMRINDSEPYYMFQFLVNLSINQGGWILFGERVLSFYLFDVKCATMLYLVSLYGMLCFHPTISAASPKFKIYRLVLSYLMMVGNLVYPVLGIVGSFGISGFILVQEFNRPYWMAYPEEVLYYIFGVSLVVTSYIADSKIIYLQGLLISVFYIMGREIYHRHNIGWRNCVFSVLVVFLSVLFESQPLLILGGAGIFLYLSYLAKKVFRNSILFPFALTVMGLSIIFIGIQYQKYQTALRTFLLALLPSTGTLILNNASSVGGTIGNTIVGYVTWVTYGLEWLSSMENHYIIPAGIGACFAIVFLSQWYTKTFKTLKTTKPILTVKEAYVIWPKDTKDHGIVIWVTGTKPQDFTLSQAELHLVGDGLWNALEFIFGSALVSTMKFTFYPLSLCNKYMDASQFKKGETTFDIEIHLGTGKGGGPKISHATLQDTLHKISYNSGYGYNYYSDPSFDMQFQYVKRFGLVRGVLFSFNLRCSQILNARGSTNGQQLTISYSD